MHVSALYRYPVKSLRGHPLERATVERIGVSGDRRWMVVDMNGRFITRREMPRLAQFDVEPTDAGIRLHHDALGSIDVAVPAVGEALEVKIWRDTLTARAATEEVDHFLSQVLEKPVRLVHQSNEAPRPVDPEYGQSDDIVSLADGFPLLVTTEASLEALNEQLATKVVMERFRPNIVVAGAPAWEEDEWRRVRIGALTVRIVKPCARCIITTQDPLTGETVDGNEPMTTLRKMGRMTKRGIIFGQNAIPDMAAEIRVGDNVEILESGDSNLVMA